MDRSSTADPRPQGLQRPSNDSSAEKSSRKREGSEEPHTRGTKRSIGKDDCNINLAAYEAIAARKRQRLEDILGSHEARDDPNTAINPIAFWVNEGTWPFAYFPPEMERMLAQRKPPTRKRSNSGTSVASSSQGQRGEKSYPYRDSRYNIVLEANNSFLSESNIGIDSESEATCLKLLTLKQTIPQDGLFRDDQFDIMCARTKGKNESRVFRDITPLIVPSAENLFMSGSKHLEMLRESINEGWSSSRPLATPRPQPQPDYSVGFDRHAFNPEQLAKLAPYLGDLMAGDQSFFLATYYIYFPFLTCEVKCGAGSLEVADRQNAHSMTLAVRAIVELFRAVKRETEIHRQILSFSVSHDDSSVRIYGHYPIIEGENTRYYRYTIHQFYFTALKGREKWTAYRFTKNVYDLWMPSHFKRICSAIDQLPDHFVTPPLPATGLSQDLESHHFYQPDADSISRESMSRASISQAAEQGQSSTKGAGTPSTFVTDQETGKRRKER